MRTQRVLITGGSGDLGERVVPLLSKSGYVTTNLDPRPPPHAASRSVAGSILDRALVSELVAQTDVIIHIAAWHGYHAFTGARTAHEFWDLNMTGTFNLLEAASRHNISRFLFISSTSRVVKNGSVVSILRVLTKRGGDDEKTGGVSTEIR